MTHLERRILFLSYCYAERIIYDDACTVKKCCVNPVQKKVTALSKSLGKMDIVVDKLQFWNLVNLWCKPNCNPNDQNELCEVSVCLSIQISFGFFGESGWGLTCVCEGNRFNSNNGSMATGGHKLGLDLQCISWRHLLTRCPSQIPNYA